MDPCACACGAHSRMILSNSTAVVEPSAGRCESAAVSAARVISPCALIIAISTASMEAVGATA